MALDGLISGASTRLVISDPVEGVIPILYLKSFSAHEGSRIVPDILMDGTVRLPKLFETWHGDITLARGNAVFDSYIARQAALYYTTQNEVLANLYQTITEQDGSTTQIQYNRVQFVIENAGDFSGAEIVNYSISWIAANRQVIT